MKELNTETVTTPPKVQKLNRKLTLEKEHKDALERAVSLNIPHAETSYEEEESCGITEEGALQDTNAEDSSKKEEPSCKNAKTNWDEVVEKLFKKNKSGQMLLKRDVSESINAPS